MTFSTNVIEIHDKKTINRKLGWKKSFNGMNSSLPFTQEKSERAMIIPVVVVDVVGVVVVDVDVVVVVDVVDVVVVVDVVGVVVVDVDVVVVVDVMDVLVVVVVVVTSSEEKHISPSD